MPHTLRHPRRGSGYSLVEVLVALAILVVAAEGLAVFTGTMGHNLARQSERLMAYDKANQMFEELKTVVTGGENTGDISVLDSYDDQGAYHYILTTSQALTMSPTASGDLVWRNDEQNVAYQYLSGNPLKSKGYAFVRSISVLKVPNDPSVRKVYVRIFPAVDNPGKGASSTPSTNSPNAPIAEVFGLLRTSGLLDAPTQVHDVYFIALENVPGWWQRVASMQDIVASMLSGMQARNPGLEIRAHWIQRMSFGRDEEYTPEINQANDSASNNAFDKVYIYPGTTTYSAAPLYPNTYYATDWFQARMNVDGALARANSYSLADQFNHCMRYPDEYNRWIAMKNDSSTAGYVQEPSLRILLEAMNNPSTGSLYNSLRNSIIINLHGEMIPIPPIRNVSDPAKEPVDGNPIFRAVTHPEKLRFNTSTEEVAFRVYAYTNPVAVTWTPTIDVVTLFFPNLDTSYLGDVQRLQGGENVYYTWISNAGMLSDTAKTFEADNYVDPLGRDGLRIRLYNVSATARAFYGVQP